MQVVDVPKHSRHEESQEVHVLSAEFLKFPAGQERTQVLLSKNRPELQVKQSLYIGP